MILGENSNTADNPVIKVMLVENQEDDISKIKGYLSDVPYVNYELNIHSDVSQAIEQLPVFNPNVCLVDYNIPGSSVFDFSEGARQKMDTAIPIIVLAHKENELLDRSLIFDAGIDDYWHIDELSSDILERCLRYAFRRDLLLKKYHTENQNKSTHLRNMALDLKNPLSVIYGYGGILRNQLEGIDDQSALDGLDIIKRNCNSLTRMVNELLNFAQREAEEITANKQLVRPMSVLESVSQALQPMIDHSKLVFTITPPLNSEVTLRTDKDHLWQILSNIICNAIKYTDSGTISIRMEENESLGNQTLQISIQDTGIGISSENFSAIFDHCQKVQQPSELGKPATSIGLGLPIAHNLVRINGGRIEVESTPNVGSTFKILLPIK